MRIVINSRKAATASTLNSQPSTTGRHTGIAPANLQAVLDSAANAVQKGQAAWFTPPAWAQALAMALPAYRPVLTDLTCGNGQLLDGAAADGTRHKLGCDIEDHQSNNPLIHQSNFIQADITQLARYLHRAQWQADCFVLNFPFDHHWYRDRLSFLEDSNCAAVEIAFRKHDGRTSKDTIDSTIAGLCLALDRCSPWGEGFVICNHATVQRLIFAEDAPHAALASHIWCLVTIDGDICDSSPSPPSGEWCQAEVRPGVRGRPEFKTSVLYFARAHTSGVNKELKINSLADAACQLAQVGKIRMSLRAGSIVRQYIGGHTENTAELWDAIGLEWRTDQNQNRSTDLRWNIWLNLDGTLKTNLTPFQEVAEPLKKAQYVKLHSLNGKHPMQLVLQKAERKELERAVFGSIWRVAPAVTEAVQGALNEYNEVRAPLYPLSQIQRLGYLDDNDDILCVKDLYETGATLPLPQERERVADEGGRVRVNGEKPFNSRPIFKSGQRYTIRTETISVKRSGQKMNLTGELDDVEWEGSELALFIKDEDGIERLFMEERLRDANIRLSIQAEDAPSPIEFNLQQLVEHFEIPDVPDVASKNPEGYQKNLALLHLIEDIVNSAN